MARRVVAMMLLLAVWGLPLPSWAQSKPGIPPIMPLREVKPGLRGIGRTVIRGQRIDEFDIEIIGVLQGGEGPVPVHHLILFRVSGPMTDLSGGTAAGMSGSPLYINGKLMGALSAGYLFQPGKRELALATPIEEMLPVLDLPEGAPQGSWPRTFVATSPFRLGARSISRVVVTDTLAQAQQVDAAGLPGLTAFIPASFPAVVSGLSPRAMGLLRQALGPAQHLLQYDQQGQATFTAAPITGGSSVGVLQVRGDVNYGGICTVALRVGDKLLICGHPWDRTGEVEYALTTSDIVTVVRTLQEPFKEGNLGELIGKIDQDRGPAIRGIIGRMPRMFAVRVTVTDEDSGVRVDKGVQVTRRRDLAKVFAAATAVTAIERARDQVMGGGTAKVKVTLRAKGLPRVISRENLFYSSSDVALASLLDLPDALNFLLYNDLAPLDPIDMNLEITLSAKRQTAAIAEALVERREVAPGERLHVRLAMRPFQEETVISREIDVQIPRNYPRGPAILVVGTAGKTVPASSLQDQLASFLAEEPGPSSATSLADAIQLFENFGKNTDVLLQVIPFGLPPESSEFAKFDVFAGEVGHTDWVVQGQIQIPIVIR